MVSICLLKSPLGFEESQLILISFLLTSSMIFSQNTLSDSQFEKLKLKVKLQFSNNLDSAFYYCNKIEASNNNLHKAFAKSYKHI